MVTMCFQANEWCVSSPTTTKRKQGTHWHSWPNPRQCLPLLDDCGPKRSEHAGFIPLRLLSPSMLVRLLFRHWVRLSMQASMKSCRGAHRKKFRQQDQQGMYHVSTLPDAAPPDHIPALPHLLKNQVIIDCLARLDIYAT
jgi:hypothetical protein